MRYLAVATAGDATTGAPILYSEEDAALTRIGTIGASGAAKSLAYSPSSEHLAMARTPSQFDLYRRTGATHAHITRATNLSAVGAGAAWYDDTHFGLAYTSSNRFYPFHLTSDTSYAYSGAVPSSAQPSSNPQLNAIDYGGVYCAIGITSSPYLFINKLAPATHTYTRIAAANITGPPAAIGWSVAFTPDTNYLVFGSNSTRLIVYARSGDLFARITPDPTFAPPSGWGAASLAFNPDGTRLAVGLSGGSDGPYLFSHDGSGGLTQLAVADVNAPGRVNSLAFTDDGATLAVGTTLSPFLSLYAHDGSSLTLLPAPTEPPTVEVTSLSWTSDTAPPPPVLLSGTALITTSSPPATLTSTQPEPPPPPVELSGLSLTTTSAPDAVLGLGLALDPLPSNSALLSPPAPLSLALSLTGTPATSTTSAPPAALTVAPAPPPEPETPIVSLSGISLTSTSTPPARLNSALALKGRSTTRATTRPARLSRLRRLTGIDPTGIVSPPAVISVELALTAAPSTLTVSSPPAPLALVSLLERRSTGIDPLILSLMPHTVLVERKTGQDRYGRETYGPPAAYPARIRYSQRIMRNENGEEIVTSGQVTIGGISGITSDDRITLPAPGQMVATAPDADETFSPLIVSVHRAADDDADVFERVTFA